MLRSTALPNRSRKTLPTIQLPRLLTSLTKAANVTSAGFKYPLALCVVADNKSRSRSRLVPPQSHRIFRAICFVVLTGQLLACAESTLDCDFDQADLGIDQEIRGNAGCIIHEASELLVIRSHNRKVSIPGGSTNDTESVACTAIRETWEETGLRVTPTELTMIWDESFYIFNCDPEGTDIDDIKAQTAIERPLEVQSIVWVEPSNFDSYEWRFPRQATWLNCYLNAGAAEDCQALTE